MAVITVRSGTVERKLVALINRNATLLNELKTDHNALLTKLDADDGVTDTNYAATLAIAAAAADTLKTGY